MTREQFLDLLHDPSGLKQHSEADLALLTSRFPYCQPLHYLHLRKLSDEQSVHYPRHLKMAAAVAPDRKQLYHFLHPESSNDSEVEIMEPERLTEMPVGLHPAKERKETAVLPSIPEGNSKPEPVSSHVEVEEVPGPAFSANDILEQRLRELNLWQEEEQQADSSEEPKQPESATGLVESTQGSNPVGAGASDLNPIEEVTVNKESLFESAPAVMGTEPLQEQAHAVPAAKEELFSDPGNENIPDKETSPVFSSPIDSEQKDPLEELIREELMQTRLRNADYFAEQGIATENNISSAEPELPAEALNTIREEQVEAANQAMASAIVIPKQVVPEVKAAGPAEVKQDGASHSFLDWLHRTRNSVNEVKDENVTAAQVAEERPPQPAVVKEDGMKLPPAPPPPSVVASPKADSGQGQVFNFSPPRTIYLRKAKLQQEDSIRDQTPQPSKPDRPLAEFQAILPEAKEEESETASPNLSEESQAPVAPVRKQLADPESVQNDPPRPRVPSSQLIDNFIRQDPRITPNKSTFYSPVNMAKKSVQEPEDLVTETLAKVYAGQGNYAKAIQVYEKLRLKFPEKKLYFASLIQELKDKSNP